MRVQNHLHGKSVKFNRREVLLGASLIYLSAATRSNAEVSGVYKNFVYPFQSASRIYQLGVETLEVNDPTVVKIIFEEYLNRRDLIQVARSSNQFVSKEAAINFAQNLPEELKLILPAKYSETIPQSQIEFIKIAAENDIELLPDVKDVQPMSILSIPPEKNDSDLIIIGDIIFDAMGLTIGNENLFKYILEKNPSLTEVISKAVAKVTTKEWDEVFDLIHKAILIVIQMIFVEKSVLLEEKLVRKLMFRFSIRAVPVLGWIYVVICCIASIKSNYHRFSFAK